MRAGRMGLTSTIQSRILDVFGFLSSLIGNPPRKRTPPRHQLPESLTRIATVMLVFALVDLSITLAALSLSNGTDRIGMLRSQGLILPKLVELSVVGLGLGIATSIGRRGFDPELVTLNIAFVLLLDLDHLPSALGFVQPIRPAHSIAFLLLATGAFVVFFPRELELEFVLLSSFLSHLAADTGLFGLFEPVSFAYLSLETYRVPLAICAFLSALLAGHFKRVRLMRRDEKLG